MTKLDSWQNEVRVNRDSAQPLYLQVKEGLETWIRAGLNEGTLAAGGPAPSEAELCRHLGVSQITAKRALEELRRQGLIQRFQGRGSFITGQTRIMLSLTGLFSLMSLSREQGLTLGCRMLEFRETAATSGVAHKLSIAVGSPVAHLVRLLLMNQTPVVLDTSYFPLVLFPNLLSDYREEDSLYDVMAQKYGCGPLRAVDILEPVLINAYESEVLGPAVGAPAIMMERVAYTSNDIPVESTKSVFRGDMFRYSMDSFR